MDKEIPSLHLGQMKIEPFQASFVKSTLQYHQSNPAYIQFENSKDAIVRQLFALKTREGKPVVGIQITKAKNMICVPYEQSIKLRSKDIQCFDPFKFVSVCFKQAELELDCCSKYIRLISQTKNAFQDLRNSFIEEISKVEQVLLKKIDERANSMTSFISDRFIKSAAESKITLEMVENLVMSWITNGDPTKVTKPEEIEETTAPLREKLGRAIEELKVRISVLDAESRPMTPAPFFGKIVSAPVPQRQLKSMSVYCQGDRGLVKCGPKFFVSMDLSGAYTIFGNSPDIQKEITKKLNFADQTVLSSVVPNDIGTLILVIDSNAKKIYAENTFNHATIQQWVTHSQIMRGIWINNDHFALGMADGTISFFTMGNSKEISRIRPIKAGVFDMAHFEQDLYASNENKKLFCFELLRNKLRWCVSDEKDWFVTILLLPSKRGIIAGKTASLNLDLFNTKDGSRLGNFHLWQGFSRAISSIKISNCEQFLYVLSFDELIGFRLNTEDFTLSYVTKIAKNKFQNADLLSMEVSWEWQFIVVGDENGNIYKIDLE